MTKWYYLTSSKMTVAVGVDDKLIITETPPVVRKFQGQPLINLQRWMEKQGGYMIQALN